MLANVTDDGNTFSPRVVRKALAKLQGDLADGLRPTHLKERVNACRDGFRALSEAETQTVNGLYSVLWSRACEQFANTGQSPTTDNLESWVAEIEHRVNVVAKALEVEG